jgi:hypothetical protein
MDPTWLKNWRHSGRRSGEMETVFFVELLIVRRVSSSNEIRPPSTRWIAFLTTGGGYSIWNLSDRAPCHPSTSTNQLGDYFAWLAKHTSTQFAYPEVGGG